nr:hypothetical protein [uncultured Mediterranean phage uvMED]
MIGVCGTDLLGKSLSMCYSVHRIYRAVTEKQIQATVRTAHHYGGSFLSKVAEAAMSADPRNRTRVLDAFPEIVSKYGPGSAFYNEYL